MVSRKNKKTTTKKKQQQKTKQKRLLVFFISSDQGYALHNFQANNSVTHYITEQTNKEIPDPASDLKLIWSSAMAAFQIWYTEHAEKKMPRI